MTYITGYVTPVPTAKKDIYRQFALGMVELCQEFGATRIVEGWGDEVPDGKLTDYKRAVKAEPDETVLFSWLEFPSRAVADAANEKMMHDPRMEAMGTDMPFDGTRMIYAGFEIILDQGPGGKMGYLDGTVVPCSVARKADYEALGKAQTDLFLEHGAIRVVDAWGDHIPDGKVTDFKRAVNATADEAVVLSFVEWPSKDVRDAAWPKIASDPRMQSDNPPQDEHRRIFGGFVPLLDV